MEKTEQESKFQLLSNESPFKFYRTVTDFTSKIYHPSITLLKEVTYFLILKGS